MRKGPKLRFLIQSFSPIRSEEVRLWEEIKAALSL